MSSSITAIIGSSGMLGQALMADCKARGIEAWGYAGRRALDVTDGDAVCKSLRRAHVVINASGYTDVDGAESDPEAAMRVNHLGPANLARACRDTDALLVHYSTDYVFPGVTSSVNRVDDKPNPCNVYGLSKLAGERAIREVGCRHLIVRTSWLFAPYGRNFVRSILAEATRRPVLKVVADQTGRPTSCRDLAEMTFDLIEAGAQGTFHVANRGRCTWYEFAREIVDRIGSPCQLSPCKTSEFPRPAKRPAFSVLDLGETIKVIGKPRHWRPALRECLESLAPIGESQVGGLTGAPQRDQLATRSIETTGQS